ncbi:hypothetical protein MY11210_001851 [Beauveria gryllotalpidicola]
MVQSTVEYGTMLTQVICRGAPVSFLTISARGLWPSESNHSETISEDPAEA